MDISIHEKVLPGYFLKATVQKIESESAELELISKPGFTLHWPKAELPEGSNVGDHVFVRVTKTPFTEDEQIAIARKILESMVN